VGMPGFAGQGSRDFALAAGSVHGYRWWSLDAPSLLDNPFSPSVSWAAPVLRGQRGQAWVPGENQARCLHNSAHEPPAEDCDSGCGFWAYWAPPEQPHFSQNALWLLGVIKGYGRTLIGSEGFRCERAQIAALHLASEFEVAPPYGQPPLDARTLKQAREQVEAWQGVIEDRLGLMYPETRIVTVRRALLTLFPPYRDHMIV
jgi:hypothetical protein